MVYREIGFDLGARSECLLERQPGAGSADRAALGAERRLCAREASSSIACWRSFSSSSLAGGVGAQLQIYDPRLDLSCCRGGSLFMSA